MAIRRSSSFEKGAGRLGWILFFICALRLDGYSQEMLGISNSSFAGNMGMGLNPSLFVGSPYHHEWNIISGDFFADNDFIYLQKRSALISKSIQGEPIPEERVKNYAGKDVYNGYGNVFLRGPSYIRNNDKYSWGFHTAFRSNVSATDIPYHVAKFMKEGFDYSPLHDIRYVSTPFRSASMAWGELGGTYGRKLYEKREKSYLAAAITVKFLLGFDAVYANLPEYDYFVPSSDTLIVNSATGEYGHALSDGENTLEKPFRPRGFGGSADLGFTYYRGRVHGAGDCNESAEIRKKYKYRIGFSLIDFGMVKFSKQAKVFSFNNSSAFWPGIDTVKFNSIAALDSAISDHFYGNPTQSHTGSDFRIFTPAAVSLQFDYCVMPRVYVNATWIQATPLNNMSIVRASQFSITPRYETRKFEAALPLTIYEYSDPHLGVSVRYMYFVLGTDRLGSFTGLWDTTGYDIYFGLKFNACELSKKGGKQPFCPAYSK